MTDITKKFVTTTELIQKELQSLESKQEMISYLSFVRDYCISSINITKMLLKEYK